MAKNTEDFVVPSMINEKFIEEVLQGSEEDSSVKLTAFRVERGCNPGDHFCSVMLKVTVSYESKNSGKSVENRLLIVKMDSCNTDTYVKDLWEGVTLSTPEVNVYSKTLSAMEKVLKRAVIEEIFWPKLIYSSKNPPILILEDIRVDNYSMIHQGIPFADVQKIVEKIALFHALSMIVHEENSELTDYTNSTFTKANVDVLRTICRGINLLVEQCGEWPGFEKIHDKLKNLGNKLFENMFKAYEKDRGWGYNVLNHGDFHIRNMMFKSDQGKVQDVKFLDFQISHWGSPALDLSCLIHINWDNEGEDRREEIYRRYYDLFRDYLVKFGYPKPIPSLLDLKLEVLRCGAIEVVHALCLVPQFKLDLKNTDFSRVFDSKSEYMLEVLKPIYEDPTMMRRMKRNLFDFYYKGYLD